MECVRGGACASPKATLGERRRKENVRQCERVSPYAETVADERDGFSRNAGLAAELTCACLRTALPGAPGDRTHTRTFERSLLARSFNLSLFGAHPAGRESIGLSP